jgi:CDP-diacylglycerol---glycerol-3-phosphate 3-phosphatidyltransferase
MGVGRGIGRGFMFARDAIARGLLVIGIRPNYLTVAGFAFTLAAGFFLALGAGDKLHGRGLWAGLLARCDGPEIGRSCWNLLAGVCIILSSATDMLDGAVARLGSASTAFGGFLDSTLDRFGDFAIFAGIALYYAWRGNVTYTLLAMLSLCNAYTISYTRARAESLIPHFRIGYWQRGERIAAVVISVFAYNIPAMLWQQAIGPAFTAWRRVKCTRDFLKGRPVIEDPRQGPWWVKLALWRWPRMTLPYDLITGANIAFLIFAPIPQVDLIRRLIQP